MAANLLNFCWDVKFSINKFSPVIYKLFSVYHIKQIQFANCVLSPGDEWKDPKSPDEIVNITFIDKYGKETHVKGKIGDNLMYLAQKYNIEIEGACEASLACTTCHVYVLDNFLDKLPAAEEKEEDLLDMAPFLKENSRLGCQIILTKELDGMKVKLPQGTRNFYVDGHKPKTH